MKTKLQTTAAALGLSVAALISGSAMAAIDVTAEAATFQSDFTSAAGVIGSAFLAAGFVGIVWKWARGMLFS